MSPQSEVTWQSRCAEFWPMQSNNVVRHQPGSACKILRDTSPGAAPQQNTLPLVGRSRWKIPNIPWALWMPVSHIHPFLFPSHLHLEWIKSLPAWAINLEIYVPIKIDLKKLWEDRAGLNFSVDSDEFWYPNAKQENLLVMSRLCDFWRQM